MPDQSQPEKRVPLGEPIKWTDEDLDALSAVSEQDVLESQSWAAQHGSPEFQGLLNAEPDETE